MGGVLRGVCVWLWSVKDMCVGGVLRDMCVGGVLRDMLMGNAMSCIA